MWIAFIDESGTPEFKRKTIEQNPLYVVSAVIINDRNLTGLCEEIEKIKNKTLPECAQKEIHTCEIVHGNKNYRGVSIKSRIDFLDKLFKLISSFKNLTIISVVMYKNKVLQAYGEAYQRNLKLRARKWMYKLLIERLSLFLSKKHRDDDSKEWMLLVVDHINFDENRDIWRDIENEIRGGEYTSKFPGSKYIILPPLFAESHEHIGLQLADAVSYVISRERRGYSNHRGFDFKSYFDLISNQFDKDENGIFEGYGLKEWYGKIPNEF